MTEDPKTWQLLSEVLEKTRADKLRWQPTVEDDRFVVALGGKSSLVVAREGSGVAFELHDQKGRLLSGLYRKLVNGDSESLWELYELARRRALNADAAIDSVLEDLRKL